MQGPRPYDIFAACAAALAVAGCATPQPAPLPATTVVVPAQPAVYGEPLVIPTGHGYLIGAHRNYLYDTPHNRLAASAAIQRAQSYPATRADVHRSTTADLNHDGFVTADEIIALHQAGLGDMEILRRLEATGHVFIMTTAEREYLVRHGVPTQVVNEINRLRVS